MNKKTLYATLRNIALLTAGIGIGTTIGTYTRGLEHDRKQRENRNDEYYEIYIHCDKIGLDDTVQIGMMDHVEYYSRGASADTGNAPQVRSGWGAGEEFVAPVRADPLLNLLTANKYTSKKFPIQLYLRQNKIE